MNLLRRFIGGKERSAAVEMAMAQLAEKKNLPVELDLSGQIILRLNEFVSAWRTDGDIEDMDSSLITRFDEVTAREDFSLNGVYPISLSDREILSFGQKLFAMTVLTTDDERARFGYKSEIASIVDRAIRDLAVVYSQKIGQMNRSAHFAYFMAGGRVGEDK